ncbi:MAG: hypothetical protein P8J50_10465 [Acidimicrobiales bacterium]|nr:hypothetical protein [Acidimicrobiales bacterium]
MKKGRHRRYEEARELKRSHDGDFASLLDSFSGDDDDTEPKPEHAAWADEFDDAADSAENAGD